MSYQETTDDQLLANLLNVGQSGPTDLDTESAEDLFELYIEGRLPEEDREEFFRYLDANPTAREAASLYMTHLEREAEEEELASDTDAANDTSAHSTADASSDSQDAPLRYDLVKTNESSAWNASTARMLTYAAMAACVLLAIGISVFPKDGQQVAMNRVASMIEQGQFSEAEIALENLDSNSTEAQLLAARAAAHERRSLGDAEPWSLLSYGYELGDAVAMDGAPPEEQLQRLRKASDAVNAIESTDAAADLARAWIALKTNQPDVAIVSLDRIIDDAPDHAAAQLARGVASFMLSDFEDAESRFRKHLSLTDHSFAGLVNLGKVLKEQGKYGEAIDVFRSIDSGRVPTDGVRVQLSDEIDQLDAFMAKQQATQK